MRLLSGQTRNLSVNPTRRACKAAARRSSPQCNLQPGFIPDRQQRHQPIDILSAKQTQLVFEGIAAAGPGHDPRLIRRIRDPIHGRSAHVKLSARVAETHPHAHKRIDWNIIGHDVFGYRHRWFEGALHHLHLSCPAHLSLTTVELNRLGKKAQRANAVLQLPSTRELQNRLRAIVWRDTLVQLRRSSCREEIIRHLERSLRLDEGVLDEAAWYQKTGQVV